MAQRMLEYERPPLDFAGRVDLEVDDCAFMALMVGFFGGLLTPLGLILIPICSEMGLSAGGWTLLLPLTPELLALVLGCIGLLNCWRHRKSRTGTRLALAGMLLALVWTGVTIAAALALRP